MLSHWCVVGLAFFLITIASKLGHDACIFGNNSCLCCAIAIENLNLNLSQQASEPEDYADIFISQW
jgi:hypothetical protein